MVKIALCCCFLLSNIANTLSYMVEASARAAYYYDLGESINNSIDFKYLNSKLFFPEYHEKIIIKNKIFTELVNVIKSCVFMKRGHKVDHLTNEMQQRLSERLAESLATHETAAQAQFFQIKDPQFLSQAGIINAPCALAIKHRNKVLFMQAQVYLMPDLF